MQAGYLNAQLPPVAGLGQGDVADMIFEVEIRIVDPIGMVEIEGNADQFLAETACLVQAALDMRQYVLEPDETSRRCRRIIYPNRPDMHRRVGGIEIDETRVLPA
jgi:hypothetical protein